MRSGAKDREAREGLFSQAVNLAVNADSTRDPCAALVLHNREFEFGKRVNPELPNFREVLLRTDNHCIVNVCKHVDFERGEMGEGSELGAEIINGNGVLQKKAEECG